MNFTALTRTFGRGAYPCALTHSAPSFPCSTPFPRSKWSLAVLLLMTPLLGWGQIGSRTGGSATVVISQVYGGGGNSGAQYKNDFIELHNLSAKTISLAGYSVQYGSSGGNTWTASTALTGSIAPGAYYLVQGAGGSVGVALPTPDATSTLNLSGTAGKVALVSNTAVLTGTCPSGSSLVDFVGFGTAANCSEGTGPTKTLSNTLSAIRLSGGCLDTDNNSTDFETGAPTPRNSSTTAANCLPSVTGFAPPSGPVDSEITISGSNLAGITSVTIGGTTATGLFTTNSSVKAIVPSGLPLGNAAVEVSDGVNTYPVGDFLVTLAGISTPQLGSTTICPGGSLSVTFQASGTYAATNSFSVELSDASGVFASTPPVIATLLNNTTTTSQTVTATLPTTTPGGLNYKVRVVASDPVVQSLASAALAVSGVSISPITAQNLYTNENGTTLTATEITPLTGGRQWVYATTSGGPYTLAGQTAATYTPAFSTANTYYVAVQSVFACGTVTSQEVTVNVTTPPAPTLTDLSPSKGTTGTQVVLTGSGFTISGLTVFFNGTPATQVQYVSPTQLKANVPAGATSGLITVTTPYGTATSTASFSVYSLDMALLDDFNRSNSDAVAENWAETESAPGGASITANQLRLSSGVAGRDFAVRDVSARYNPVLGSNDRVLSWAWNMQQSRPDPAGFGAGSYGVAYVLAGSSANLLSGVGYAVILGNSGSTDPVQLVRYSNGLSSNSVVATVSTNTTDFGNQPLTLRVSFDPESNTWTLEVGSTTTAFQDPLMATYQFLGNAVDDTYATTALPYTGAFWNHNTTGTEYALFDNVSVTAACALAAEPATGSDTHTADQLTSSGAHLSWAAGSGSSRLVVVRAGQAPTTVPQDGATYTGSGIWGSGSQLAAGEQVVYQGSGTEVTLTNLQPNTAYYYRIYDADGSGCATNYQPVAAVADFFTTKPCLLAAAPTVPASQAEIVPASYNLALNWTNGNGAQRLVVVRDGQAPTTLPVDGTAYLANARLGSGNAVAPNEYAVYRGTGSTVTVTGLAPGRTYYAVVYELNGTGCSTHYLTNTPAQAVGTTTVPPVGTYRFYRGNLHAHSSYSDGNKDGSTSGALTPYDDYGIARQAEQFDFLGISEHNHNGAGMVLSSYAKGLQQADQANQANVDGKFLALYGMEWGTISGGGHVIVYGYDQLIGWEAGNYDVFVQKGDYTGTQGLFATLAQKSGVVAYLAHPNATDYNGLLQKPLDATASQVVTGMAMRSGPAFSTATDYSDPSASTYESRFKDALKLGYHVGPVMDHDNHNSTFGRTSYTRLVVLASELTRPALLEAMQQRRFYAADDANAEVTFKISGQPMGSQLTLPGAPTLEVNVVDQDGEAVTSIELLAGIPGSGIAATSLTTSNGAATLSFTDPISNEATYYYYAVITQADGDKIWTAPIRYTRRDGVILPVSLTGFEATLQGEKTAVLRWVTAQEQRSGTFIVERSINGRTFMEAGRVAAAGNSTTARNYEWRDAQPLQQLTYYRLRQVDRNGAAQQSPVRTVSPRQREARQVHVFPTPTAGNVPQLALRGFEGQPVSIRVISMVGRTVWSQSLTPTTYQTQHALRLPASLPQGMYTVQVTSGGQTYQTRLLLTR